MDFFAVRSVLFSCVFCGVLCFALWRYAALLGLRCVVFCCVSCVYVCGVWDVLCLLVLYYVVMLECAL